MISDTKSTRGRYSQRAVSSKSAITILKSEFFDKNRINLRKEDGTDSSRLNLQNPRIRATLKISF